MGLLKKKKKKKSSAVRFSGGGGGAGQVSSERPQAMEKLPPCIGHCPSGNDIRGWLSVIQLHEKLGLSLDEACEQAFDIEMETNPFPSVMVRVCPHPCEDGCNRAPKDGAVAVHAIERFLGDWSLERGLALPTIPGERRTETVGVVGSGPAGLSYAYQMARRGYPVTVYEGNERPGGMLQYGIPQYRLPDDVVDAEFEEVDKDDKSRSA